MKGKKGEGLTAACQSSGHGRTVQEPESIWRLWRARGKGHPKLAQATA